MTILLLVCSNTISIAADGTTEAFVERLYNVALGRSSDEEGKRFWVDQLNSQTATGAQVAAGFIFSEEAVTLTQDDPSFIDTLYITMMDRKADDSGKTHWLSQLNTANTTRYDIFMGFVNSPEWFDICNNAGLLSGGFRDRYLFIDIAYLTCLGREPDAEGRDWWFNEINSGRKTGTDLLFDFCFSDEFMNMCDSDDTFISMLYCALLGRTGDEQGITYWKQQFQKGTSKISLFDMFAASEEFHDHCARYGVPVGNSEHEPSTQNTSNSSPYNTHTMVDIDAEAAKLGLTKFVLTDVVGYMDSNNEFVPAPELAHLDGDNAYYDETEGGFVDPVILDERACYGTVVIYGKFIEPADEAFMKLISEYRVSKGLPELPQTKVKDLIDYCRLRAVETSLYFSHARPNGQYSDVFRFKKPAGFNHFGENVAYSKDFPEIDAMSGLFFDLYIHSRGHELAILMDENQTQYSATFERYVWDGNKFVKTILVNVSQFYNI